ncbi:CHAT domain-containing protein [Mesorhizobium sp. B2-8-5]|uniref:CHAT domain-containing protein n=1 Tax=Mesorhizobium sp. B2-8-5 TaxID=2589903 RepID=UPI00112C42A1|nr:CHAT domain-containing protein [Mesorhizobium sp. B2-8-5]UCI24852.1 hypothetical protein FJ430_25215 [Mesorhizobium sp. B2-8-5]
MVPALESLIMDELGFCVVLLTGTDSAAQRAAAWIKRQPRPVLHVTTASSTRGIPPDEFTLLTLRDYCFALFSQHADEISSDRAEAVLAALPRWDQRKPIAVDLPEIGHNCTIPNQMVLRRMGRALGEKVPHWSSVHEADYTRLILESARAVLKARDGNGLREWNRLYLPDPKVVLTEPALFRHQYKRLSPKGTPLAAATMMMLRRVQNQKGLAHRIDKEQFRMLATSKEWTTLIAERQHELVTHTIGVGLMAAQSCAAVVRLRPEVNHVFPQLSELARNIRAPNPHARSKSPKLLGRVQAALERAVGAERIAFLKEHGGPIKIVADAPLELLPIDGIPLAMRYDTSRINATPGNLMMGELVSRPWTAVLPNDLMHVLIVSAFASDDPLRDDMRHALDRLDDALPNRITLDFRRVTTVDEFVETVNSSDAPIMIFDGHGAHDSGNGVGGLSIGTELVDVWQLRPRMRSRPIVILSACDTHGMDAPSHATAGNSFIALGAQTVLATLLPVGGKESASFVYRLLFHLAEFVPSAISNLRRALSWVEIMASALRLTLAKDVLERLVARRLIPSDADILIFRATFVSVLEGDPDWFGKLRVKVREAATVPKQDIMAALEAAIACSEAIRYIQLGMPERIVVGNQAIFDEFISKAYERGGPVNFEMDGI